MSKVFLDKIPELLRARKQWCNWKLLSTHKSKKPTKVPLMPEGKGAKSNDPSTWSTFSEVSQAVDRFDGVGFFFANGDGLVGVDLDHCFDESGNIKEFWRPIVDKFLATKTWIELSPSGGGLHIWCRGRARRCGTGKDKIPVPGMPGKFEHCEVYDYTSPRYFTVTGNTFAGEKIASCQAELDWLQEHYMPSDEPTTEAVRDVHVASGDANEKRYQRALDAIPGDDYQEWIKVGMALKAAGFPCSFWDQWSLKSPKYQPGACEKKWKTFKDGKIGPGTVFEIAKSYGYTPKDKVQGNPPPPTRSSQGGGSRPGSSDISCSSKGGDWNEPSGGEGGNRRGAERLFISLSEPKPGTWMPEPRLEPERLVWDDPTSLLDSIERPDIPSSVLPPLLAEMAEAVAYVTETPIELAILATLSIIATCVQKKFRIYAGGEWEEPLSFWTLVGLESGSRKSAAFRLLSQPIKEWESQQEDGHFDEHIRIEVEREVLAAKITKVSAAIKNAETEEQLLELKERLRSLKRKVPDPIPETYALHGSGDTSVEGLQEELAQRDGRFAILDDEGGLFKILGGLYSRGLTFLDTFNKAWDGSDIRPKRASRKTRWISNPALTLGLVVQPATIRELGINKTFRETGFLARFVFAMPESTIGSRDSGRRALIPPAVRKAYTGCLHGLLSIKEDEKPVLLTLSKAADSEFKDWSQMIEDQLAEGQPLEHMRDWGSKHIANTLRIAGLLHLAQGGEWSGTEIQASTMSKSLKLGALLVPHALYSFSTMAADPVIVDAKVMLSWMVRQKRLKFKSWEVENHHHFKGERQEKCVIALAALLNKNIVQGPFISTGRGRRSIYYKLNPALLKKGVMDAVVDQL